jgi:hypothetical protein
MQKITLLAAFAATAGWCGGCASNPPVTSTDGRHPAFRPTDHPSPAFQPTPTPEPMRVFNPSTESWERQPPFGPRRNKDVD